MVRPVRVSLPNSRLKAAIDLSLTFPKKVRDSAEEVEESV